VVLEHKVATTQQGIKQVFRECRAVEWLRKLELIAPGSIGS
jgi:hypothetical protein